MSRHFVKMTNSELNTKEPKYSEAKVKVNTVLLKKMAKAVGITKGSPSQILQAFLEHSLTI